MQITIKRLSVNDAPALCEMAKQTFYSTFKDTCTPADMQLFLEENYNQPIAESELLNNNDWYFFAEVEGVPAGYLRFMEDYSYFPLIKKWKAIELKRLYVLEAFHGKGIAQQLMDFLLAFANENKYEVVWLGVWENNFRAQKFYSKYSFSFSNHTHDFPIGNTPQTDQWWWKFLST